MPGLLIKDFPENLHKKLKERAAQNKRSMTKEALYLLEIALTQPEIESKLLPPPIQGKVLLTDDMINAAKVEGRE